MNKDFKNCLSDFAILSEENQHPREEQPNREPKENKENGTYISRVYCSSYNNIDGQPHQECFKLKASNK